MVGGVSPADVDRDADLDIHVTYWTRELAGSPVGGEITGEFPGRNTLYVNEGGFRFTDATVDWGLGELWLDSFTSVFHDFDQDADLDLSVAVDHRNDRYLAQTDAGFRDDSVHAWANHRGNDMGIAVAHVDGDDDFDMSVTNVFDPQAFGVEPPGNTLLLSEIAPDGGARFVDEAEERGVLDAAWGWGTGIRRRRSGLRPRSVRRPGFRRVRGPGT